MADIQFELDSSATAASNAICTDGTVYFRPVVYKPVDEPSQLAPHSAFLRLVLLDMGASGILQGWTSPNWTLLNSGSLRPTLSDVNNGTNGFPNVAAMLLYTTPTSGGTIGEWTQDTLPRICAALARDTSAQLVSKLIQPAHTADPLHFACPFSILWMTDLTNPEQSLHTVEGSVTNVIIGAARLAPDNENEFLLDSNHRRNRFVEFGNINLGPDLLLDLTKSEFFIVFNLINFSFGDQGTVTCVRGAKQYHLGNCFLDVSNAATGTLSGRISAPQQGLSCPVNKGIDHLFDFFQDDYSGLDTHYPSLGTEAAPRLPLVWDKLMLVNCGGQEISASLCPVDSGYGGIDANPGDITYIGSSNFSLANPDPGLHDHDTFPNLKTFFDSGGTPLVLKGNQQNVLFRTYVQSTRRGMATYIAPSGQFTPDGPGPHTLMCGLGPEEFLFLQAGDTVTLVPGPAGSYPATAPWISVTPDPTRALNANGTPADGTVGPSYCSQTEGFTFYARPGGTQVDDFPKTPFFALGLKILGVDLHGMLPLTHRTGSVQPGFALPMAPYSAALTANETLTANTLETYEGQVLHASRWNPTIVALDAPAWNMFNIASRGAGNACGPIFFDLSTGKPVSGGSVRTPQGFVIKVSDGTVTSPAPFPAGAWSELVIACNSKTDVLSIRSLDHDTNNFIGPLKLYYALASRAAPIVASAKSLFSADLASSFTKNAPFKLDEFPVFLDLQGQDPTAPISMAIFKFSRDQALYAADKKSGMLDPGQPSLDPAYFLGDPVRTTAALKAFGEAVLEAANLQAQGKAFDPTLLAINNPDWTGMLFLNCPLDASHLPSDIAMLLGGIDGELVAQYVAISDNTIDASTGDMQQTSAAARIYYKKDWNNDDTHGKHKEFQTLLLDVHFSNSELDSFACKVGFQVPSLFREDVKLTTTPAVKGTKIEDIDDECVVVIDGAYVREPGQQIGHVVFDSRDHRTLTATGTAWRAIHKFEIDDVALVPISATPVNTPPNTTTDVESRFTFSGDLYFAKTTADCDLFSFDSLAVTNYSYLIQTTITSQTGGGYTATLSVSDADMGSVILSAEDPSGGNAKPRQNSLCDTFPWKVVGLRSYDKPSSAADIGAFDVLVPDLPGSAPAQTANKIDYAFVVAATLGSLGAYSNGVVRATLLLGWSYGGSGNANKVFLLLLPPNGVSLNKTFQAQAALDCSFDQVRLQRMAKDAQKPGDARPFLLAFDGFRMQTFSFPIIVSDSDTTSPRRSSMIFRAVKANDGQQQVQSVVWDFRTATSPASQLVSHRLGGVGALGDSGFPTIPKWDALTKFNKGDVAGQGLTVNFDFWFRYLSRLTFTDPTPGDAEVVDRAIAAFQSIPGTDVYVAAEDSSFVPPPGVSAGDGFAFGLLINFFDILQFELALIDGTPGIYGAKLASGLVMPDPSSPVDPHPPQAEPPGEQLVGSMKPDQMWLKGASESVNRTSYVLSRESTYPVSAFFMRGSQLLHWSKVNDNSLYVRDAQSPCWRQVAGSDGHPFKGSFKDILAMPFEGETVPTLADDSRVIYNLNKFHPEALSEASNGLPPNAALDQIPVGKILKKGEYNAQSQVSDSDKDYFAHVEWTTQSSSTRESTTSRYVAYWAGPESPVRVRAAGSDTWFTMPLGDATTFDEWNLESRSTENIAYWSRTSPTDAPLLRDAEGGAYWLPAPPPPPRSKMQKRQEAWDKVADQLAGLEILGSYLRLQSGRGVVSAAGSLPRRFRVIDYGGYKLGLPDFGFQISSDGGWLVLLGWPISNAAIPKIMVAFPVDGIEVMINIALKFGHMNGADFPGVYDMFDGITMLGLGISAGASLAASKGSFLIEISETYTASIEGFIAKTHSNSAYTWLNAFVAMHWEASGTLSWQVFSIKLTISLELSADLARETGHATHLGLAVTGTFNAELRLFVLKLKFSVSVTFTKSFSFGDGPEAITTAPTPLALLDTAYKDLFGVEKPAQHARTFLSALAVAPTTAVGDAVRAILNHAPHTSGPVELCFTLAPTATFDGTTWSPQLIALLAMKAGKTTGTGGAFTAGDCPFQDFVASTLKSILSPACDALNDADFLTMLQTLQHRLATKPLDEGDLTMNPALKAILNPDLTTFAFQELTTFTDSDIYALMPMFPGLAHNSDAGSVSYDSSKETRLLQLDFINIIIGHALDKLIEQFEAGALAAGFLDTWIDQLAGFSNQMMLHAAQVDGQGVFVATGQQFPAVKGAVRLQATGQGDLVTTTIQSPQVIAKTIQPWTGPRLQPQAKRIPLPDAATPFEYVSNGTGGNLQPMRPQQPKQNSATILERPAVTLTPRYYTLKNGQLMLTGKGTYTYSRVNFLPMHLLEDLTGYSAGSQGKSFMPQLAKYVTGTPYDTLSAIDAATPEYLTLIQLNLKPVDSTATNFTLFEVGTLSESFIDTLSAILNQDIVARGWLAVQDVSPDTSISTGMKSTLASVDSTIARANAATTIIKPNVANDPDDIEASVFSASYTAEPTTTAPLDFVRLVWEASVANALGYHLRINRKIAADTPVFLVLSLKPIAASWPFANAVRKTITPATNAEDITADLSEKLVAVPVWQTVTAGSDPRTNAHAVFHTPTPAGRLDFDFRLDFPHERQSIPLNPDPAVQGAYIATLYHAYQCRIGTGPWSPPVLHRLENPADENSRWLYDDRVWLGDPNGVLPGYKPDAAATPYDLIGNTTTQLNFQVLDIFGNAHPTPIVVTLPERQYTDPLLPIGQWHGTHVTWAVHSNNGAPWLQIFFEYQTDPSLTDKPSTSGTETSKSKLAHARELYQKVAQQLADSNVTVNIVCPLLAASPEMPRHAKSALSDFLKKVLTFLNSLEEGKPVPVPVGAGAVDSDGKPIPSPADQSFVGITGDTFTTQLFPQKAISQPDLFELSLDITLTRPPANPADTDRARALALVPELQQCTMRIPVDQSHAQLPGNTDSYGEKNSSRAFAIMFEAAYKNYAGPGSLLKIAEAQGSTTDSGGNHSIWAVKWNSGTSENSTGLQLSFKPDAPSYFAPRPLCTRLLNRTVSFDGKTKTRFNNIALDDWGREFLEDMERLLTPSVATYVASQSPRDYRTLMEAKIALARVISSQVISVNKTATLDPPDLAWYEEQLMNSLGSDYGANVIVSVPARISNITGFNLDPKAPPPFFTGTIKSGTNINATLSLSNAQLPMPASLSSGDTRADFTVSAKTLEPNVSTGLQFQVTALDYHFDSADERFGFIPSRWLHFTLPATDAADDSLTIKAPNPAVIPLPVRAFPPQMKIKGQSQGPYTPDANIASALTWTAKIEVTVPETDIDVVTVFLCFNEHATQADDDSATDAQPGHLFESLAQYRNSYPGFLARLKAAVAADTPIAADAITGIATLVNKVSTGWALLPEAPQDPVMQGQNICITIHPKGNPIITQTGNAIIVDAPAPTADKKTIIITCSGMDLGTHRSLRTYGYVTRNNAGSDNINPAFVYRTPTIHTPGRLLPYNEDRNPITIANTKLSDAFAALLSPFKGDADTSLSISLSIGADFVISQRDAETLQARTPLMLVQDTPLNLKAHLVTMLQTWRNANSASTVKMLALTMVVQDTSEGMATLARLSDIRIPVGGNDWWQ